MKKTKENAETPFEELDPFEQQLLRLHSSYLKECKQHYITKKRFGSSEINEKKKGTNIYRCLGKILIELKNYYSSQLGAETKRTLDHIIFSGVSLKGRNRWDGIQIYFDERYEKRAREIHNKFSDCRLHSCGGYELSIPAYGINIKDTKFTIKNLHEITAEEYKQEHYIRDLTRLIKDTCCILEEKSHSEDTSRYFVASGSLDLSNATEASEKIFNSLLDIIQIDLAYRNYSRLEHIASDRMMGVLFYLH